MRAARAGLPEADLRDAASFASDRPATPLIDAPALASALGLSRLLIKDETHRWDLNAFKITGAGYALERMERNSSRKNFEGDGSRNSSGKNFSIVTASAGNHGRAVARAARERGLPCRVFLPSDALPQRLAAIRDEGADVVIVDGSYEEAVARAAGDAAATGALLVSDTAPPGDPAIPALIVRGYTRIFSEAEAAWPAPPGLVVVQGGVGGLVGAAAGWLRTRLPNVTLIAVEPEGSACLGESARAGQPITLPHTEPTSMVCLRCATPNSAAWPLIAAGVDGFVTVTDAEADEAVRALARAGIAAGASGACGLAGLAAIAPDFPDTAALIVVTEGP